MNYNNKTKAQLIEDIMAKEKEILDLKDELRQLEKCQKYDDVTAEIAAVYDKLINQGFDSSSSLEIVNTMIAAGRIPCNPGHNRVSYRSYY